MFDNAVFSQIRTHFELLANFLLVVWLLWLECRRERLDNAGRGATDLPDLFLG
jgi:hypothetical protein